MKKIIKNLIIPIIIVLLFAIVYFIIIPNYKSSKASEEIFNEFEVGLTNLKIEYSKEQVNANEFGAKKAYSYNTNEKLMTLYIFNKNSKDYQEGLKNGYITSKDFEETKLYGIFMNNCVLFIESDYPSNEEVVKLFTSLSENYIDEI